MPAVQETVARVREIDVDKYKYGFFTDIESVKAPKGLSEDVVRFISAKKNEPEWLLDWRLEAYRRWITMQEPTWANVHHPKIDYQDLWQRALIAAVTVSSAHLHAQSVLQNVEQEAATFAGRMLVSTNVEWIE